MSNFLIKNYVIFSPLPAKYREGYTEIYTQKNKNQGNKKKKRVPDYFPLLPRASPVGLLMAPKKTGERNRVFMDSGCDASLDTSEP